MLCVCVWTCDERDLSTPPISSHISISVASIIRSAICISVSNIGIGYQPNFVCVSVPKTNPVSNFVPFGTYSHNNIHDNGEKIDCKTL